MTLYADLRVGSTPVSQISMTRITNTDRSTLQPDEESNYLVTHRSGSGLPLAYPAQVTHRYGDGAEVLLAKSLAALWFGPARCWSSVTLRDEEHALCECVLHYGHTGAHSDGCGTTWTGR